jgi:hypothetical protein
MSDEPTPGPDLEQAPGWQVIDPDGNVVDSGPIVQLEAVGNPDGEEQE